MIGKPDRRLRRRLPHRPRRYWRYVSPQRRGLALFVLALLLTAIYGYWYLTNDSRIRRQARRYLRDITGAQVSIDHASFSMFGGIRLKGVRLDVPGARGSEPFFSASSVILKHRPWSVFFGGSIKPTEIISLDAEVTNSPETRAFMLVKSPMTSVGAGGDWDLPVIRMGTCRYKKIDGNPLVEKRFDLGIDMIPQQRGMIYDVYVADRKASQVVQKYHIGLQLSPTFDVTILSGWSGDLVATTDALPSEYSKWIKDYQIEGRYSFEGPVSVSGNTVKGVLKLKLENVSFKLPKAQGGLSLSNVTGTLIFTPPDESKSGELKNGRIELMDDVAGKVTEAGGATIRLSGVYQGYRLDSPFRVRIEIDKMTMPKTISHPGICKIIDLVNKDYQPVGQAKVVVDLSRAAGQDDVSVSGKIWPLNMSGRYRHVPYRIDDLTGEISFNNKQVVVKDLVGKRQGGTATVNALIPLVPNPKTGKQDLSVTVDVDSMRMTEALSKALPKEVFPGKPYPLENITGRVHAVDSLVWVEQDNPMRATGPGGMRCAIYGQLKLLPKGVDVSVYIKADDVPLDKALIASMDKPEREAMGLLSPSGLVERLLLKVHHRPGEKFQFDLAAGLKNVNVTYKGFPYSLTGLKGNVTVKPGLVELKDLSGYHNKTPVRLRGRLYPDQKNVGVDLTVNADDLVIDKELYQALPANLKKIWKSLSPSGKADIALLFKQDIPGHDKKLDYRLEVSPKGMSVTYDAFPYKLNGITGLVVASPELITLQKVKCDQDYQLDGVIRDDGRKLKLKIDARGVPLDKKLLAAFPDELSGAMSAIEPGGTLDINFKDLTITHPKAKPSTTRPGVKTAPASYVWKAVGSIGLHDTMFDMAFGAKKLNGTLTGQISQGSRGLAINAKTNLQKIMIGNREVTDVRGRITKKAGSPLMRIEDLEAKAYGGQLAGREVLIRLSDPVKYAFSLFYQNVSFSGLVNAEIKDPTKRTDVKGLLEGRISLEATVGDPKSRRAAGTVVVTKGKMYKMPIMIGLMHVLYLSLPGDAAFTEGHLKYFVQGDTMVLEEIFLTGSALSLVGSGKMTISNEKLDLTFLTGPPGRLPRIAVIRGASKLLNTIVQELLVIRVTGSLTKPIRTVVPLRSIDALLKDLLSPGKTKK
ncbi:MAG: AsmA-like C-terminal region-containing protein [bacterium]|nr:AsmA-like C-terminal region-containing protein [bacterium]